MSVLKNLILTLIFSLFFLASATYSSAFAASLSLESSAYPATLNSTVTLDLLASDVANLGSYQFTLHYDPELLEFQSVTDGSFLSSTARPTLPTGPFSDTDQGIITFGAFSLGNTPPGPDGSGILATLTFTAIGVGDAPVSLSQTFLTDITSAQIPHTSLPFVLNIVDAPASPSPTPTVSPSPTLTPTTSPTPTLSPTPVLTPMPEATTMYLTGSSSSHLATPTSLDLYLSSPDSLSGVDVILHYDPLHLDVTSITHGSLFDDVPFSGIDPNSGTITFSQVNSPHDPTGFTGEGLLATIHFTPVKSGLTDFEFAFTPGSKADTNAIDFLTGADTLDSAPSFSLSVSASPTLDLLLETPSDDPISGHSVSGTLSDQLDFSLSFTTDASGSATALPLQSTFIGQAKTFFLKVSGFLVQSATTNIEAGLNLLNFGLLKAGDLNDDGIINTADVALMYAVWNDSSKPTADFNQDGNVNSADYWLLTQNYLAEDD